MSFFGNLVSAAGNIVSGLIGQEGLEDERTRQNVQAQNNREDQERQLSQGIQRRVADARAAGIHPLYALGASVPTYSPVSLGSVSGSPMAAGLSAASQDIGRAINAGSPPDVRMDAWNKTVQDLTVTNMTLKNELLSSQIKKINQAGSPPGPPIPSYPEALPPVPESKKQEDNPLLQFGGSRIGTDPSTSPMEAFEKRYGDEGPVNWAAQLGIAWKDLQYNLSSMSFLEILRAIDRKTAIGFTLRDLGIGYKPGNRFEK